MSLTVPPTAESMRRMRHIAILAAFLLSCDSDDAPSAADHCRDFVSLICTRAAACDGHNKAECIESSEASLPGQSGCDGAVDVVDLDTFEVCLSRWRSMSCEDIDTMGSPPECTGQLVF